MSIDSFAWLRGPRLAALAGAAALLAVHTASAQECEKDADCGDGYVCKTGEQIVNCADPAAPCAMGDKCPEIAPPDCQTSEYKYCAAAPCAQDSDCPSDMACVEYTSGGCTSAGSAPMAGSACKPGEDCPQVDPAPQPTPEPECMVETVSECTPRYRLPCEHDADCGAGFKCKEQISVSCSGSSGSSSGSSGGGFDPGAGGKAGTPEDAGTAEPMPVPADTCTSEPTGQFMCELEEIACETADDCPDTFECQDNPNRAVCMTATAVPPPNDGAGGHASAGVDAGVAPDDNIGNAGAGGSAADDSCGGANDGVPKTVCLPRGYNTYGGRDAVGVAENTGTDKGGSADPLATGMPVPGDDGNGGKGGETSGSTNGTHSAPKPAADNTDMKASDGCAVAAPGSTHEAGHGLGLLGVLGISALLMRRRARRTA